MTCHELAQVPLTDPDLAADVVDLFVSQGDRRAGVLSALICDADARFLAAIHLDLPEETAHSPQPKSCAKALAPLIPALRLRPDGALLSPSAAQDRTHPQTTTWTPNGGALQPTCRAAIDPPAGLLLATPDSLQLAPLPTPTPTRQPPLG